MAADNSLFGPADTLRLEDDNLATYAMHTRRSRGRRRTETEHVLRAAYPRDRDRIIHSTAFRRLMHKTQVLVTQTNDHHRTRLTHTLEVTQISRTIAPCLRLNEDLTEVIALSHDLGHPPFGHAGERAHRRMYEGLRRLRAQCTCVANRGSPGIPLSRFSWPESFLGSSGGDGPTQQTPGRRRSGRVHSDRPALARSAPSSTPPTAWLTTPTISTTRWAWT